MRKGTRTIKQALDIKGHRHNQYNDPPIRWLGQSSDPVGKRRSIGSVEDSIDEDDPMDEDMTNSLLDQRCYLGTRKPAPGEPEIGSKHQHWEPAETSQDPDAEACIPIFLTPSLGFRTSSE